MFINEPFLASIIYVNLLDDINTLLLLITILFPENRLLGFCNTPNSWHQAPPTRLNIDTNRDCFQVNLFLCTKKAKDLEILYKLAVHLRDILKKLVK